MRKEDWIQIHDSFRDNLNLAENYIKEVYGIENPDLVLVYLKINDVPNCDDLEDFCFGLIENENSVTIVRDLPIQISTLLFVNFGVDLENLCGMKDCHNAVEARATINALKRNSIIRFSILCDFEVDARKYYGFHVSDDLSVSDDLGELNLGFEDMHSIGYDSIPDTLAGQTYDAVGQSYKSPFVADDVYCFLFAQKENKFDDNAIEIRRWFPLSLSDTCFSSLSLYLFNYGYISKQQNAELHSYMMEHNCRLLLGIIKNKKLNIIGGMEQFKKNYIMPPFLKKYLQNS